MRSEEFDRIRRRMSIDFYKLDQAAKLLSYFNPADPWNTIFQLSHPDASHKADRFWQVEVKDKCTAYLTQIRTWNQVMDDGTPNNLGPGYQSSFQGGKRQRLRNNNKTSSWSATPQATQTWQQKPPKTSPESANFMLKDAQGIEICRLFNDDKCEAPCPRARSHVCKTWGESGHSFTACTKISGKPVRPKGKKGKGKGKESKAK